MVENTPYTEEDYKYGKYYLLIEGQYMYNYVITCTYSILLFGSLVMLIGMCFFSCGSTQAVVGIAESVKQFSGQKTDDDFYERHGFNNPHDSEHEHGPGCNH